MNEPQRANADMRRLDTTPEDSEPKVSEPFRLNVLVVYEDLRAGLRAVQVLDRTVQPLEVEMDMQLELWRFDLLRDPVLFRQTAKEAAEADIVFLSAHGQAELPATINLWLHNWYTCKGDQPHALVVCLDTDAEGSGPSQLAQSFRGEARTAGVDVFVFVEEPKTESESIIEDINHRAGTRTMVLDDMLHRTELRSFRDWGINE